MGNRESEQLKKQLQTELDKVSQLRDKLAKLNSELKQLKEQPQTELSKNNLLLLSILLLISVIIIVYEIDNNIVYNFVNNYCRSNKSQRLLENGPANESSSCSNSKSLESKIDWQETSSNIGSNVSINAVIQPQAACLNSEPARLRSINARQIMRSGCEPLLNECGLNGATIGTYFVDFD